MSDTKIEYIIEKNTVIKDDIQNCYPLFDIDVYCELIKEIDGDSFIEDHFFRLLDYDKDNKTEMFYQLYQELFYIGEINYDDFYYMLICNSITRFYNDALPVEIYQSEKEFNQKVVPKLIEVIRTEFNSKPYMPYYLKMVGMYFKNRENYGFTICSPKNTQGCIAPAYDDNRMITLNFRFIFMLKVLNQMVVSVSTEPNLFDMEQELDDFFFSMALLYYHDLPAQLVRGVSLLKEANDAKCVFEMVEQQMYFVLGHEYAHIALGHNVNGSSLEAYKIEEVDADEYSATCCEENEFGQNVFVSEELVNEFGNDFAYEVSYEMKKLFFYETVCVFFQFLDHIDRINTKICKVMGKEIISGSDKYFDPMIRLNILLNRKGVSFENSPYVFYDNYRRCAVDNIRRLNVKYSDEELLNRINDIIHTGIKI